MFSPHPAGDPPGRLPRRRPAAAAEPTRRPQDRNSRSPLRADPSQHPVPRSTPSPANYCNPSTHAAPKLPPRASSPGRNEPTYLPPSGTLPSEPRVTTSRTGHPLCRQLGSLRARPERRDLHRRRARRRGQPGRSLRARSDRRRPCRLTIPSRCRRSSRAEDTPDLPRARAARVPEEEAAYPSASGTAETTPGRRTTPQA